MIGQIGPVHIASASHDPGQGLQGLRAAGQTPRGGGEAAASAVRAETAQRVDPAYRADAPAALPDRDLKRRDELLPSDPHAPAGPAPAFDRSFLEKTLSETMSPPNLLTHPEEPPEDPADRRAETAPRAVGPYAAPPFAEPPEPSLDISR